MMEEKNVKLMFWGKEVSVELAFSDNETGVIDPVEQLSYEAFLQNSDRYSTVSLAQLKAYMHANEHEILAYTSLPAIPRDVYKLVSIDAVRFYCNGTFAIFCDTGWDSHGLALFFEKDRCEVLTPDQVWFRT